MPCAMQYHRGFRDFLRSAYFFLFVSTCWTKNYSLDLMEFLERYGLVRAIDNQLVSYSLNTAKTTRS